MKKIFTSEEAKIIGNQLRINWKKINPEQFRIGLRVELERGIVNSETNITFDILILTGKIAIAHLYKFPDYYQRLEKMEKDAEAFWSIK